MSSNIFTKNPSVFTDVPGNKECSITNTNINSGLPKRVIILRHCDQGYKPSCIHDPKKTTCPGCEFTAPECQTNLCNETGVKRSWQYGNWLACYAKTNQIPIVAIFSQIFKGGVSNQRPQTTASIACANLLQQKNTNEWISKNLISGIELRSHEKKIVKADEYSGSKFKVFSVIDCEERENRESLLYDMATASILTSGKGIGDYAPSPVYINEILENKISIFNNWDALCLFDSFTCIGNNVITQECQKSTWAYTYFRIYLFRLFFKYNI
jgi:hypothetical protein